MTTNGTGKLVQLLVPVVLAVGGASVGAYVAVSSRMAAIETRLDERTSALRAEVAELRRTSERADGDHEQRIRGLELRRSP